MKTILKSVLIFQGLYWSLTGIWAIVSLESFSRITRHFSEDAFEMHSIAALAVVLGLFFIYGASKDHLLRPTSFLLLGSAIAVIIPEVYYLPREGGFNLFWLDLIEEIVVALIVSVGLLGSRTIQKKQLL